MYEYKAEIKKIIDGDTLKTRIDLGFSTFVDQTLRINRIDAYETRLSSTTSLEQKKLGLEGKAFLTTLLPVGTEVIIKTEKTDKYGRYVADVTYKDIDIGNLMVDKGYAVKKEYD